MVAHELAAVVMPERQAGGDALAVAVEVLADALAEWLEASKRVPRRAAWMPTHSDWTWLATGDS